MSKLHFLFIMLNISQVNIVNQGQITGIISKLEFLKKRKQEEKLMREKRKQRRLVNYISQATAPLAHLGNAISRGIHGGAHALANHSSANSASGPHPTAASRAPDQQERLLEGDTRK